jgi:hypothetical protein
MIKFSFIKFRLFSILSARPWTVDIASGTALCALSWFFWFDPLSVINRSAYTFLDRLQFPWLEGAMFVIGLGWAISETYNWVTVSQS